MTADDLRRAAELLPPGASVTLPREALLEALGAKGPALVADASPRSEPDHWFTAEETATKLNVSVRWCYDHADQLGVRRLSRRCVRFSARAVERHMNRRRTGS